MEVDQLPVFVNPVALSFMIDDPSNHKQTITISNPYKFLIRFRLLATAPNKYRVNMSSGSIKSGYFVDLTIRHLAVSMKEVGVTDYLRVEISHQGKHIGNRNISLCVVKNSLPSSVPDTNMFQSFSNETSMMASTSASCQVRTVMAGSRNSRATHHHNNDRRNHQDFDNRLLNAFLIFLIIFCGLTMLIPMFNPHQTTPSPKEGFIGRLIAVESRPSFSQQLLAAFSIGVSITILFYQNLRI